MQVVFQSRHPNAQEWAELSEQRVRFALRRLRQWVRRAEVQMSDTNGPRGGVDKQCAVEIITDGAQPIVVKTLARDWRTALDAALARVVRALTRMWQRQHRPQRVARDAALPDGVARWTASTDAGSLSKTDRATADRGT